MRSTSTRTSLRSRQKFRCSHQTRKSLSASTSRSMMNTSQFECARANWLCLIRSKKKSRSTHAFVVRSLKLNKEQMRVWQIMTQSWSQLEKPSTSIIGISSLLLISRKWVNERPPKDWAQPLEHSQMSRVSSGFRSPVAYSYSSAQSLQVQSSSSRSISWWRTSHSRCRPTSPRSYSWMR